MTNLQLLAVARLADALLIADTGFLAALDTLAGRLGASPGFLAMRKMADATMAMGLRIIEDMQSPTEESARAVHHHAHVMGLPVGVRS